MCCSLQYWTDVSQTFAVDCVFACVRVCVVSVFLAVFIVPNLFQSTGEPVCSQSTDIKTTKLCIWVNTLPKIRISHTHTNSPNDSTSTQIKCSFQLIQIQLKCQIFYHDKTVSSSLITAVHFQICDKRTNYANHNVILTRLERRAVIK